MNEMNVQRPILGAASMPADFRYMDVFTQKRPRHEPFDPFMLKHPQMDPGHRAKIFSPFAALKGFSEIIASKEILYEPKKELDEEQMDELNRRLVILHNLTWNSRMARKNRPMVRVRYFCPCTDENSFFLYNSDNPLAAGRYEEIAGMCRKVDAEVRRIIQIEDQEIALEEIIAIEDTGDRRLFETDWDPEWEQEW